MTTLNEMTREQLLAHIATLKTIASSKLSMKVTDGGKDGKGSKGAISVYGLGRFPITLYRSQWERLLEAGPALRTFIDEHASQLASKGD